MSYWWIRVVRDFRSVARWAGLIVLLVAAGNLANAQTTAYARQRQLVESTQRQVRKLTGRFAPAMADEERDRTASAIRQAIRTYVEKSVRAADFQQSRAAMMQGLKKILPGYFDELPLAFVLDSSSGLSLIVFYSFGMGMVAGPNAAAIVLDAFRVGAKGVTFAASTGSDMNGYLILEVHELSSPVKGQLWLLLSGQMAGANGPNTRMRVYAFDGKQFRTRWAPANIWGDFQTRVTSHGFDVTGTYYYAAGPKRPNQPETRDDRYVVTPGGVYLTR